MPAFELLLVALLLHAPQEDAGWSEKPPPALLALERSRSRIEKAEFTWTHARFKDPKSAGRELRWRSIISGDQVAYFKDGTAEGVTDWTADGDPIRRPSAGLHAGDEWWDFDRNDLIAELYRRTDEFPDLFKYSPDLRSAGLLPAVVPWRSVRQALWEWPEPLKAARRYRQREINGLYEVEMQAEGSANTCRWYIDPAIDWNVVQCQFVYADEVLFETVTEYERVDGTWCPVLVTQFDSVGDAVQVLEVENARINPADIADQLSPDLLGLGNGMPVLPRQGVTLPYDENGKYLGNYLYGTGGRLLTIPDYARLEREGAIETDPRYAAKKEEYRAGRAAAERAASSETKVQNNVAGDPSSVGQADAPPAVVRNRVDDEWERYTRNFIARHKLNEAQKNAAWKVLRDCQEQRTGYLRSRRNRLLEIEERLSAQKTEDEGRRLLLELHQLREPVRRIFEEQLKPRLLRIPTRTQRNEAADPSSEP